MLDLGGRSVIGDQSKGKEGKLLGYSVLDTVKLRNGLVPDPERLPDIMKKHFIEQMADFVARPWSEGQGGDLDGEHSDLLTHSLAALVGKQNDEAFGGNALDTQWKKVKRITLSSIKTLEDLTTRMEDLRDSEITLYQNVGTGRPMFHGEELIYLHEMEMVFICRGLHAIRSHDESEHGFGLGKYGGASLFTGSVERWNIVDGNAIDFDQICSNVMTPPSMYLGSSAELGDAGDVISGALVTNVYLDAKSEMVTDHR
jgi:hypothetical protein